MTFPPVLRCEGIISGYGDVQVLFGVGLHIERSEVVALLGANGAGKTTLLRVISGLEELWSGEIHLNDQSLAGMAAHRRVDAGICQIVGGSSIAAGLTVDEHMRLWSTTVHDGTRVLEERVAEAHELFPRLAERGGQDAGTLSGGEKQMLALAKALIVHPELLIIDEFSLGLAPKVVGELLPVIRRINRHGSAVLLVEQSANVALSLADRAYCMEKGSITFSGSSRELADDPDLLASVYLQGVAAAMGGSDAGVSR